MSKEKKEKSAIYNIVAFNFAGKDTAKETVKEIKRSIRAKTISGLSNISYGLPRRRLINHAFLVLARGNGLDAAILDPTDKAMMGIVQTIETLMGKDPYCMGYLKAYRGGAFDV